MFRRHMLGTGVVAVIRRAQITLMNSNPAVMRVDSDLGQGNLHINGYTDVVVWSRIELLEYTDMVRRLHDRLFPLWVFVRCSRQGCQGWLFLSKKDALPAAFSCGERHWLQLLRRALRAVLLRSAMSKPR